MVRACPDLRSLSLYWNLNIGLETPTALAESCPRLERINLSGCKAVTDLAVERLARGCTQLTHVDLTRSALPVQLFASQRQGHPWVGSWLALMQGLRCASSLVPCTRSCLPSAPGRTKPASWEPPEYLSRRKALACREMLQGDFGHRDELHGVYTEIAWNSDVQCCTTPRGILGGFQRLHF